jgi:Dyp-type peroxidase family
MVTTASVSTLPFADIQGLILRGYNMAIVRHFVLRIDKADRAKVFIDKLVSGNEQISPQITGAAQWEKKPSYCLNIGFTYQGLKALKLQGDFAFSSDYFKPFIEGAAVRSKNIGDWGENAPENWQGELGTDKVHILLSVHAQDYNVLELVSGNLRALFKQGEAIHELSHFDGAQLPDSKVHFGFKDGIAQPIIEGVPTTRRQIFAKENAIPAYRFVLIDDPKREPYYEIPTPHELGLNGGFVAFRVLEQDVEGFEKFLQTQADKILPEMLAAKMCGRWRNGVPLDLSPDNDAQIFDDRLNDFDYSDDREGFRCPVGSHIRRTNPRKSRIQGVVEIHRIVRRGMPYGPPYDPNSPDDGIERGLLGMFICTLLDLQFEFVMAEWVNKSNFSGFLLPNSKDPLLGNNSPESSKFEIPLPDQEKSLKLSGFQQFIKTRGGAYCFLPSITALKYIANH